jgi:hypothetical protein
MTIKNKITFEVDGVKWVVKRPTPAQIIEGDNVYNRTVSTLLKNDGLLSEAVSNYIRQQGIWDDARQKEMDRLDKVINDNTLKLRKGGAAGLTKSAGKELAIQIKRDKFAQRILTADVEKVNEISVQRQGFVKRIEFYVSACTLDEKGKPVFKDFEDYTARKDEPGVGLATSNLMLLLFNVDSDAEKQLPENAFLLKYGYVDNDLRLIDKEGNWVDFDGRRIDKEGYLLNDELKRVDEDGNLLDENGEVIIETAEFLEDEV